MLIRDNFESENFLFIFNISSTESDLNSYLFV